MQPDPTSRTSDLVPVSFPGARKALRFMRPEVSNLVIARVCLLAARLPAVAPRQGGTKAYLYYYRMAVRLRIPLWMAAQGTPKCSLEMGTSRISHVLLLLEHHPLGGLTVPSYCHHDSDTSRLW